MQKIDSEDLPSIAAELDELPPRRTLGPYEVIAALEQHLTRAQGRGYDLDALLAVLGKRGIRLSRTTARNYLRRARREARASVATVPTQPAATQTAPKTPPRSALQTGAPPAQSIVELARARVRDRPTTAEQQHDDTPGSFKIRPDKVDL